MKRLLLAVLMMLSGAALAQTPSASRDYTNLWFNANESGWGMNVIHQERILFVTIFAYGTDRKPTWFVGPATTYASTDANGAEIYTGDLYVTTGPAFNAATFDATSVTVTRVGSITFTGRADGTASVTYNVDSGTVGTGAVTKSVTRQTWAGHTVPNRSYVGGWEGSQTSCRNAGDNGAVHERLNIALNIAGTALTMDVTIFNNAGAVDGSCHFQGNYTQTGRLGTSTGTAQCPAGTNTGTYTLTDIAPSATGFNARLNVVATGDCNFTANIGGVKVQ
jgi:hypothetical protein